MSTNNEMQIRRMMTTTARHPNTLSSTNLSNSRKSETLLYNDVAIRSNENSLEQCRTSVSVLSGCVAGILGLTSYKGFIFYGVSMFMLSFFVYLRVRNEHEKYFKNRRQIFLDGFFNGLLTYVLFWTFLYGMVHVY